MIDMDKPAIVWTQPDSVDLGFGDVTNSFSPLATADAWAHQETSLSALRNLADNWDGEGARKPSNLLIRSAEALLKHHRTTGQMPPPSSIAPTTSGTIFIEWQIIPEIVSLEIMRPYEGAWLFERPGYPAEFRNDNWRRSVQRHQLATISQPQPIEEDELAPV